MDGINKIEDKLSGGTKKWTEGIWEKSGKDDKKFIDMFCSYAVLGTLRTLAEYFFENKD